MLCVFLGKALNEIASTFELLDRSDGWQFDSKRSFLCLPVEVPLQIRERAQKSKS